MGEQIVTVTRNAKLQTEGHKPFRPTVYWYPSFRCNLACRHCWVNSSPRTDTSNDLGTEELLSVVDQLVEFNAGLVIMSGGEALYRPDALLLVKKLIDARIQLALETNGLLFTPRFVELAHEAIAQGVPLGVSISLDGGTALAHNFLRGEGTFERTMRGMSYLHSNKVPFYVQCVINAQNIDSISEFIDEMEKFRPTIKFVQFSFLNRVGRGDKLSRKYGMSAQKLSEAYQQIAKAKGRFTGKVMVKCPPALIPPGDYLQLFSGEKQALGCTSCAFPTLGVLNDGTISICALTRDDASVKLGNVRTDRLLAVWRKVRFDILRQNYVNAELTGICRECVFRTTCKGSCRAHAFEESGSFDAPHPLCAELEARGEFPEAYRSKKTPVEPTIAA